MKNSFKFGFLALAISLSVAACGGNKTGEDSSDSTSVSTDSTMTSDTTTVITDSSATTTTADTTVVTYSVAH